MSAESTTPITVVVPTRDRAPLLTWTLRSIAAQTLAPAQVIVADDGSRDETAEVAGAAGARVLHNPRGDWGAAGARNAALAEVETELVAFLDSDDLLHPEALARLHSALCASPMAPFAFGRALAARRESSGWISEGLIAPPRWTADDYLGVLFVDNPVPSGGALTRVAAAREVGGFDTSIPFSEDHLFWLALARRAMPVHVAELVCVYRRHAGGRHPDSIGEPTHARIDALADHDPRLAAWRPSRRGVQVAELALDAARRHDGIAALAALRRLLNGPRPAQALRAAGRFLRRRRRAAAVGQALLATDRTLSAWLADYR